MKYKLNESFRTKMLVLLVLVLIGSTNLYADEDKGELLENRIAALEGKVAILEKAHISSDDLVLLQKLIIEFSDELALVGVKVQALEDTRFKQSELAMLQALLVEFSDELALLGVKVTAMEDDLRNL